MKKIIRISGLMLAIAMAGTLLLPAQPGMRGRMGEGPMQQGPKSDSGIRQGRNAQHRPDSLFTQRMIPSNDSVRRQMHGNRPMGIYRAPQRRGFQPPFGPGYGFGSGRQGRFGNQFIPMRPEMGRPGQPMMNPPIMGQDRMRGRQGDLMLRNITDLTDNQKEAIEKLRKENRDEMDKLRQEFQSKMESFREEHRKKILGLLTDDQKKKIDVPTEKAVTPSKQNNSK